MFHNQQNGRKTPELGKSLLSNQLVFYVATGNSRNQEKHCFHEHEVDIYPANIRNYYKDFLEFCIKK